VASGKTTDEETQMTIKQKQIVELVKSAGQEGAEDMLVCMGWASSYSAARRLITAASKACKAA
jgi:biotin synthase-like enzyme